MSRSRASAKAAGTRFERSIADSLAEHVDDRIDRRVKNGSKDRGDVAGIRHMGGRVVIECKDVAKVSLGTWVSEAEIERGNDDAVAGLVVHKRRGHGDPLDQYVTCTLRDLVALLTGERPAERQPTPLAPSGLAAHPSERSGPDVHGPRASELGYPDRPAEDTSTEDKEATP